MPDLPKYLGMLARTIIALIPLSGFAGAASSNALQFRDVATLRTEVISRLKTDSRVKEAIQCLGGNGYINDFPTGRLLRDAKLYEIGAGTSEIRRMLIGRELFEETR